ncbi:MAG: hypothetical protein EAY72_08115 [Bacteroidetes bacterium]|nr:MAG: hypothetical protein EAY72_08115 [Bacteroidota bacterium]
MKKLVLAITAMYALTACNLGYEKTASGFQYKLKKGKGGDAIKAGMFVKMDVEYRLDRNNDSLLNSTYGKVPVFTMVDTSVNSRYSFMEILPKAQVGDSGEFVMSIDSLKSKKMIPDYSGVFKKGGLIKGKFRILQAYKTEADVTAAYQKELDAVKQREIKDLENYLTSKGIKTQKTKSGAFVAITEPGDLTNRPDSTKQALIMYAGKLRSNGKVFDTNLDNSKGHTDPLPVIVGQRRVILGWEEALPFFGKGGKGTIYIPSSLAWGPQSPSPDIPPYSDVIFDVQIKDVTAIPATAAAPPPPPQIQGAPAEAPKK